MTPNDPVYPSSTAGSSGSQQFSVRTALVALRCWWHLALPLGLLLGATAAGAVYAITKPTFTASRWLLIMEKSQSPFADSGSDDSRRFVNNQIELLRSPLILELVASDPGVASAPELATQLDPVNFLRSKLRIRALGQSEYFEISFTSRLPEKAALIVDKVAEEYFARQQKDQNQSSQRMIELLQQQQTAQHQEVKTLRKQLDDISKDVFGKGAFTVQDDSRPLNDPLAELETQSMQATVELAVLKAHIQAVQEEFNTESFETSQVALEKQISEHPRMIAVRQTLNAELAKLADTKKRSSVAKHVTEQTKIVDDARADLETTRAEVLAEVKEAAELTARSFKQDQITALQIKRKNLETTVEFLSQRLAEKRGAQRLQAGDTLNYELVKGQLDRAYLFHEQISARILAMQAQQRAPARVELLQKAKVPARPDEELPFKMMGLAGGAGLFAPFALAVLLELLFRRVSERGQIEAFAELNLIGEVTTLPRRITAAGSTLNGGGRDLQLYEESIDGLRTLLMLFESTRGHKVLSVTSAVSGEGKTSVAAQLAVSIASATNRPTLLIDGDMRSPDVHRIFDVDLGPGLCDVLSGSSTVEEAVETGFSEHLHLLTAGQLCSSPHRLMGGAKFHDLIERLKGMYEFIVIDTPPILPASEALLMSSAADSAILCVRRDFSRTAQMSEAARRLRSSGVNLAGAVLSGVPVHEYSNRYGSYYYTRARYSAASAAPNTVDASASAAS